MSELPRFVVLKSVHNSKYLSKIISNDGNMLPETFLKFDGDNIASPFAKFEIEVAEKNPEFVHIRCCHNNKYLVRESLSSKWIVAAANQPVQDIDAYSCTMFKPVQAQDKQADHFRFVHVQSRNYACLWRAANSHTNGLFLYANSIDQDLCDLYKVLDWESLVIFPKVVSFKLSGSSKYLSQRWIEGYPYLQFVSTNSDDPTTANEISTFGDGYVKIRSLSTGKFWRRSPNWIWADSNDSTGQDVDTLFWPVKIADNIVVLRNLGNNHICKSLTTERKKECLNAAVPNITNEAKLEVHERIISRSIYNIRFRPNESRIYNQKVIENGRTEADNYTDNQNSVSLKFSYKNGNTSTIGGSVSLKLGLKAILEIKAIPVIIDNKIEFSYEATTTVQWGKTITDETTTETVYNAQVPAMTKIVVTLIATQGTCDVPFSYTQRDTLYNGDISIKNMDDGMYTGTNMFSFKFDSRKEELR